MTDLPRARAMSFCGARAYFIRVPRGLKSSTSIPCRRSWLMIWNGIPDHDVTSDAGWIDTNPIRNDRPPPILVQGLNSAVSGFAKLRWLSAIFTTQRCHRSLFIRVALSVVFVVLPSVVFGIFRSGKVDNVHCHAK